MDRNERDAIAAIVDEALERTLASYGLSRVEPGLTSEYDVAYANDVAFLSVVVEPRDPFFVYVGRLVDGRLPSYVDDDPWHHLDVDFFYEHAGEAPPSRPPTVPRPEELAESLRGYDATLPGVVGPVLEGDATLFERVVAEARARADDDDDPADDR